MTSAKLYTTEKLINFSKVRSTTEKLKALNKIIGFTNGCFDLLHPGHIQLIKMAKKSCDILIVGLNSDKSVKILKGNKRPIQNELTRALILSSLTNVDFVTIFNELHPLKLIKTIRPNVLFKGSDYILDQVVGADFVISYGGKVEIISLLPSFSTTNIIKNILYKMRE